MKRAVIFDLDGTLVDSLEDLAAAMNRTLERRGLPVHPIEAYRRMVGDGFRNLVLRAVPEEKRDAESVESARAEAAAFYAEHCLDRTRPYAGVPELLAALAARRIPTAVLSNKPNELTLRVVGGIFAAGTFAFVRGETEGFARKPDPASALDIALRLGIEPRAALYLGDSDVDMATARAAGMVALGAGWGFRGEAELRAAGAEAVLAAPIEVLSHL
ncbi:MAG: HAD family hydrolase [Rectinemataceae bacterium]